jgi:hypothetical protein
MGQNRKIGRPIKPALPGTRVQLGLKVSARIKALLDQAATANARTQSQEAEFRLEQSFLLDDLIKVGLAKSPF